MADTKRPRSERIDAQQAQDGQWRATLIGANGEPLWQTTEGYTHRVDLQHAIDLMTGVDASTPVRWLD